MKTYPQSVGDIVAIGARRAPARVAVRDRAGTERTYAELHERSTRLANGLVGLGLKPGDRVAAWMEDCAEHVEVYFACAKAGLVVCPVNARFTASEAAYILADSEARALLWTPGLEERVASLPDMSGELLLVSPPGSGLGHEYEALVAGGASLELPPPASDSLFILGFTSGTTGKPKGAMLTHRSVLAIARMNARSFRLSGWPVVALTGSMSFVAVVPAHVLCALSLGGTVTIMGKWDPDSLLYVIERDRATFTYVPSPLLPEVTEALSRRRAAWQSLDSVLHSASRASADHLGALYDVVGSRLIEGWGMTEHSGGLATATVPSDYLGATRQSGIFAGVGRAAVDVDIKVVDGQGAELPHDGVSVGELCLSSPALMAGYWRRPDATAAALADGWYRTGDAGTIDPDGYVTVSDRRTDLIVSGGANVYPSEVEICIAAIPEVREVAVVGVPHPRWGQAVVAVVVKRPDGSHLTEDAVIQHCRRELAGYKKPTQVIFMPELPRTTSLKISRVRLREQVVSRLTA
ncbi:fatty acid--CoA ligase [Acrocarpospora macrocephala]|uniref:Acyl-CoA synthetase n=1 Tax=Acrocarpospora macrocephala TaxID=150177 RepID=A0A5M3WDQ0_9ACTN|nr:AMP-binding protein [Acrocarpospora macrocephala]GES07205.1 acyl-CoA synthetase [Acrocarpospora macrocephala]